MSGTKIGGQKAAKTRKEKAERTKQVEDFGEQNKINEGQTRERFND